MTRCSPSGRLPTGCRCRSPSSTTGRAPGRPCSVCSPACGRRVTAPASCSRSTARSSPGRHCSLSAMRWACRRAARSPGPTPKRCCRCSKRGWPGRALAAWCQSQRRRRRRRAARRRRHAGRPGAPRGPVTVRAEARRARAVRPGRERPGGRGRRRRRAAPARAAAPGRGRATRARPSATPPARRAGSPAGRPARRTRAARLRAITLDHCPSRTCATSVVIEFVSTRGLGRGARLAEDRVHDAPVLHVLREQAERCARRVRPAHRAVAAERPAAWVSST